MMVTLLSLPVILSATTTDFGLDMTMTHSTGRCTCSIFKLDSRDVDLVIKIGIVFTVLEILNLF